MNIVAAGIGALVGLGFGWVAPAYQHLLYSEEKFRLARLAGRRLLVTRTLLALAAAAVVGIALRPDHYDAGPALLTAAFGLLLVVAASTDVERRRIPNRLTYPAVVAALAFCWAWPDRSISDVLIGGGVALAIGAGLYILGSLVGAALGVTATPFGMGDVKLIILLGLLTGLPAFFSALFIGVIAAGVPGLIMLLRGRAKSVFSYGPYLIAGGLTLLLWPASFV